MLEIGPGLGALTVPLLEAGARVTAVEVDRRIADYLRERLGGAAGFTLRHDDALACNWESLVGRGALLVANLPYSITGPVIARLIDRHGDFERAVLMVQREVARRLTASAGGKAIGAPTVLLRLLYRVERLFDVGAGAFLPAPQVASSVLELVRVPGADVTPALRDAVDRAFRGRRKMLRKTLGGVAWPEGEIERALEAMGRPPAARPEELEPEDWPELMRRLERRS